MGKIGNSRKTEPTPPPVEPASLADQAAAEHEPLSATALAGIRANLGNEPAKVERAEAPNGILPIVLAYDGESKNGRQRYVMRTTDGWTVQAYSEPGADPIVGGIEGALDIG